MFNIKLEEIEEIRRTARIAKLNDELLEHLASTVEHLLYQNKKYGVEIPNKEQIQASVKRAQTILREMSDCVYYMPKDDIQTTNQQPKKTPKESTEPNSYIKII